MNDKLSCEFNNGTTAPFLDLMESYTCLCHLLSQDPRVKLRENCADSGQEKQPFLMAAVLECSESVPSSSVEYYRVSSTWASV